MKILGQDVHKTQQPKTEVGCVKPLKGEKTKCVLKIVPDDENCETFQVIYISRISRTSTFHGTVASS